MPPSKRNASPTAAPASSAATASEPKRPIHAIRIKSIRGAIWANDSANGVWYNVTFSRSYKDDADGQWKSSDGFSWDDLLTLAKVADLCHTWITAAMQEK